MLDGNNLQEFIYHWSITFPIDKWWRNKHNVPFGSKRHRDICPIDQLIEYKEDQIFRRLSNGIPKYDPGAGNWLNKDESQKIDIDRAFDNLNINNIKEG